MPRGFILQPTYRIEAGRPVVHLYGVLEDGASFLVRDHGQVPHFWIRRRDADAARRLGATVYEEDPTRRTVDGDAADRIEVTLPSDVPPLRERLSAASVTCYEADVRFAYRPLMERGIRSAVAIQGRGQLGHDGVDVIFDDPELAPGDWTPELSTLSIDIETDPRARRILSIALAGCGAEEVLLVTPPDYSCPRGAVACSDERVMLERFVERVRELDPEIITGWNVVDFDLAVLLRRAEHLDIALVLGRDRQMLRLRTMRGARAGHRAVITGRLVMDGIELVRGAFVKLDDYSLNGAARAVLGKQKTMHGRDRAQQIIHAFHHEREGFVEYNLRDAQLVLEILEKLKLIELSVQRSLLTGLPPDRVAGSIAAFDFLYLSALAPRRIVAPSVRDVSGLETQGGGHVLDPQPGLYRNALMLDFRSLYPSIIRTFQIDPVGLAREAGAIDDPIVAPNGAAFSREPGILPSLLDELFPRRAAAQAAGDPVASHAIKILMNSFYGVLGTPACRFAAPALVNAITGFGREILLWSKARIESAGYTVLYGDTDSLFVLSDTHDVADAHAIGERLAREITADLGTHIHDTWRVESRLELQFERLYLRLLLPYARHASTGARKRYAGLVADGDETHVEFTGLEVVRRDWTELAKQVQRSLYERLFHEQPVEDYLRTVVADLRQGRLDDLLVYRKGLRRPLASYTTTTPPHVAAARKMRERPGRVISYVMTRNGPEPATERASPLDHEHYVQKQVRAVAEPVLAVLDLDFDEVVGDERQLRLF